MLNFYCVLGRRLHDNRLVIWSLALGAICVFIGFLFFGEPYENQTFSLVSIVILLWMLCLIIVGQVFSSPVQEIEIDLPLIDRMRSWLLKIARWIMALIMTGLSFFMILLSLKTLGVLLNG
jgi:hypothetical protein